MVSFLKVSPPKPCTHLISPPFMPRTTPISFSLIKCQCIRNVQYELQEIRNKYGAKTVKFAVLNNSSCVSPVSFPVKCRDSSKKFVPAGYFHPWSTSRPHRFASGGKTPGTHWIGGWVGTRAGLDVLERKKKPVSAAGIRTPERPARSLVTIEVEWWFSTCVPQHMSRCFE